jgi:hypothetical protein
MTVIVAKSMIEAGILSDRKVELLQAEIVEIIDGELFVTRTPHFRHQQTCGKIASSH